MRVSEAYQHEVLFDGQAAYDLCKFPIIMEDLTLPDGEYKRLELESVVYCLENSSNCRRGTQWLGAFLFNGTCLIITAMNFLVMTCGAFYFYPRYFGTLCNFCYSCCHCTAWFACLSTRFNPLGALCAANVAPSTYKDGKWDYESTTYKDDGGMLAAFGILQSMFWFCQCCFCCLPCLLTPVAEKKKVPDGNSTIN